MKIQLIYFSGTGNTELISNEITARLRDKSHSVETVSIEKLDYNSRDFNFSLRTMDMLGFGFPVYKFSYPEIMKKLFPFLSNLKPSPKPFFVFSTYCRFPSTALQKFSEAIENTGSADTGKYHTPVALCSFKCPSNGIASLKSFDSREYSEVMYFTPATGCLIDDFAEEIISAGNLYLKSGRNGSFRSVVRQRGGPFDRRRERLVGKIEQIRYPHLSVDAGLCIGCGLCARRCPDDNLFMGTSDGGKALAIPRDTAGCLHCLRCLHICPKKAISFGPLVNGPNRYTPKVRRKLFAEAESLSPGSPEAGSRLKYMRWAVKNIIYYLLHKNN